VDVEADYPVDRGLIDEVYRKIGFEPVERVPDGVQTDGSGKNGAAAVGGCDKAADDELSLGDEEAPGCVVPVLAEFGLAYTPVFGEARVLGRIDFDQVGHWWSGRLRESCPSGKASGVYRRV
jgi:hypothetical protein